jgi:histidinol-phosphatase (PHP family)
MVRDDFDDWRMRQSDLGEYVRQVEEARLAFPELTIRLALEVDYLPGHEGWIRELATRYPWDYFIGSVHYISDSFAIDSPYQLAEWRHRDPYEVWTAYFDRLTQAAESGLFEIIGHADLCKKFCFYPKEDCTPHFRRFLEVAKRRDVAIELNTAGLRKDCKEIYPSKAFLQLAATIGVPITFGSDAHAATEPGMDFEAAVQLARECGYTQSCVFSKRQRSLVDL